jgi:type IV pilus assembly protein PilA
MQRFSWFPLPALFVASFVLACGAGPTPDPGHAAALSSAPASAAPPAPVAAGPARRAPPEALLRYWAFDMHPRVALYADLGGLLHTELGRAIVPAALALAKGSLTDPQGQCLRAAGDSVRDLTVGADDGGGVTVARFDDTAFDLAPCLQAAGAHATTIPGATQAFQVQEMVVVHEPGLLIAGPEALVSRAIARASTTAGAAAFPDGLSLGPDEYVVWASHIAEDARLHGTLLASSERFRIGVEADVPLFIAQQVENQLHAMRGQTSVPGLDGAEGAIAAQLLQSVDVKRNGSHLEGSFDVHEPPPGQARALGMMASLAIAGVRKYLGEAKSAEARATVSQIAKSYVAWWDQGKARGKRKLASFPPVPKTIPRGTRYTSTPADWKAWDALHFQIDQPQFYQYEVQAAKDGRSAEVIARGDVDGDGQTSEFRLHITLDVPHGTLTIAPRIDERDPEQ